MTRIALGTAQFGSAYGIANRKGQIALPEAQQIVHRARESGVKLLDTAVAYGDSEQRLGAVGIEGWHAVTKLPAVPPSQDVSAWIREAVLGSLQRLGLGSLYGLLLHQPGQLLGHTGPQIYDALQSVKKEGLARKIGVSVYGPTELADLLRRFEFDLVQTPLNVFDRRMVDAGVIARAEHLGIEVHVRSIFLQGLLLMTPQELPPRFNRWRPLFSRWHEWLHDAGLTPMQACVRFALASSGRSSVVVGVDSWDQFDQILEAARGAPLDIDPELQTGDVDLLNPSLWPGK